MVINIGGTGMHKQNKNINLLIQKIAAPRIIISSLLAFIVVMIMVNIVFKQNYNYLTQTFNYTPQYAYQLLNGIGSTGRNSHLLVFLPDIIMVLLYSILLIGANYAIFNKLTKSCTAISIITFSPLILSLIQLMEIIILTIILLQYPNQLLSLAQFANIITIMKTVLTVVFFVMPLVGLCTLGMKKFAKRV